MTTSNSQDVETAKALLEETQWFAEASDELRSALAAVMTRREVKSGHVFAHEGLPIKKLIIIESGTLERTKLNLDDGLPVPKDQHHKKSPGSIIDVDFSSLEAMEKSVVVDEVSGRGRVTGMLHVVSEGERSDAFATVRAKGPAVVWLIAHDDFLDILKGNASFALELVQVMSKMMRVGSKSLRGLLKSSRPGDQKGGTDEAKQVCRVLCYDTTSWVTDGFKPAIEDFNKANDGLCIEMDYTSDRLSEKSATYSAGYDAVCLFVNDDASAPVIKTLSLMGVKCIVMRSAGFDRVDQKAARAFGLTVARVPAYSPYAVAEHAIALLMSVNRKIHRASARVNMANFTLDAGLMGMDIHGKTIGVMGTGKIGQILCNILMGFGANLMCYDVFENEELKSKGAVYATQDEIYAKADVIFLMMPLLPATHHTINDSVIHKLKRGVIIINTARGGLIDTKALLSGLQSGIISGCGLDVFENESEYFFQDWSARNITDPDLVSLLGNNNVVLTSHQAFFTQEAVNKIVQTTLENLRDWKNGMVGKAHPNSIFPKD